jgi:hypothetical protein
MTATLTKERRQTMPILNKVLLAGATSLEETKGTQYNYTNGYGQLTKAGVSVQEGATAEAKVDIKMVLVSLETSQSWFNEHKQVFTEKQQSRIQGHFDKENTASGWNAIFAWGAKNSENENYFQNANAEHEETTTDSQRDVVNSASKLQSSKVHVKGKIKMTGLRSWSTRAFVFAQISKIQFGDGTYIQSINQSDPVAAAPSGDTGAVVSEPGQKLNVVGIG